MLPALLRWLPLFCVVGGEGAACPSERSVSVQTCWVFKQLKTFGEAPARWWHFMQLSIACLYWS